MTALLSDITSAKELLDSLNVDWANAKSAEKPLRLKWCLIVKNQE